MRPLFEQYRDTASAKDGGFVFQAVVSYEIKWEIKDGETLIDPNKINSILHRLDIFPDIRINKASAMLSYVVLSEVNLLKRKFELASEAIKKLSSPTYSAEVTKAISSGASASELKAINTRHFQNTYFEASLIAENLVLREVSSSGIDSGSPKITLKISTGMVNTLDGEPTQTWEKIKVKVDGTSSFTIPGVGKNSVSTIKQYDEIDKVDDLIFRTIIPSIYLEATGDRAVIDTLSNRSSQTIAGAQIDYDNLFDVSDKSEEATQKP
jgi:hypothetical protein